MKKINSKQKGNEGERELASLLREHGFSARRGQQFAGSSESPDVIHDIPKIHIECKRVEKLNIANAMAQATRDARDGDVPTVFHRKNRQDWLVTLTAHDFLMMMKTHES